MLSFIRGFFAMIREALSSPHLPSPPGYEYTETWRIVVHSPLRNESPETSEQETAR